MKTDRSISSKRLFCTAATAMVAAVALVLVMASLSSARNETALLGSPGTGADPEVRYVTITADLPTYDPTGEAGVTKTVYFNNVGAGTITVTFDISGTPALTLTAGSGFAEPERIYTSTAQTSSQAITYAVVPADTTQPNVPYTATNINGIQTAVAITYVRDITAPVSGSVVVNGGANYATQAGVTLTLSATDAGCGVAARCITDTGTACTSWEPFTTTAPWTLPGPDGGKIVYAWFRDHLLSASGPYTDAITLDRQPPTVVITAPTQTTATQFLVSWSVEDATSGVASRTVEYSNTMYTAWQDLVTNTTATTATFTVPVTETDYIFRVIAFDRAGHSAQAQATTRVGYFCVYLPVFMRSFVPLVNGDFEHGLSGWSTGQGPFLGHGSGVTQTVILFEGSNCTLLGEPGAADGSIPVGYGYVAQQFSVVESPPRLQLQYRVITSDTVWGSSTQRYYDSFELSINRPPDVITDTERDNQGCRDPLRLNPTGVLTPAGDGLVFCGGRITSTTPPSPWDSGWLTVTLDLSAFANQHISLYMATWSREYDSRYYDDMAYYNTYSYVDNVSVLGD